MNYRGHWAVMNFGYWAVEEKSSGLYIGDVGFSDFKREIVPSIEGLPELGWVIAPSHHAKGFATEAVGAAVQWGVLNFARVLPKIDRMVCMIAPENASSLRVASKCGFIEYLRTKFQDSDSIMFQRRL